MVIEALPSVEFNYLLPLFLVIISLGAVFFFVRWLDSPDKIKVIAGFSVTGIALVGFAAALISLSGALGWSTQTEDYRAHLLANHGLKLEENSSLLVALQKATEDKISEAPAVTMATICDGAEALGTYELFVTREGDNFHIYQADGKTFSPCSNLPGTFIHTPVKGN